MRRLRTFGARARAAAASATGYGSCGRCGRSWATAEGHTTMYTRNRGMFPLCEPCWQHLGTPERRFPYYQQLTARWRNDRPDDVIGVPTDARLRYVLREEAS